MIAKCVKDITVNATLIPKDTYVNYVARLDASLGYQVTLWFLKDGKTIKYNCAREFFEKNFK